MLQLLGLLRMLISENLIFGSLERKPEEALIMASQDQVVAWHAQGEDEGPIAPVYHLNALACGRLVPDGGTVVDLGCGSGRFASYLARYRTDLKIVGYDLSEEMVRVGNVSLKEGGLADRVELRVGDMTAFSRTMPSETALVASVFAMHHLPGIVDVKHCFRELAGARDRNGCAIWLFDLARPRHASTARAYPEVFTPSAPEVFKQDSINSLLAAYSHEEIRTIADDAIREAGWHSVIARWFPLYQAYWIGSRTEKGIGEQRTTALGTAESRLSSMAMRQYQALKMIMPGLPGQDN